MQDGLGRSMDTHAHMCERNRASTSHLSRNSSSESASTTEREATVTTMWHVTQCSVFRLHAYPSSCSTHRYDMHTREARDLGLPRRAVPR